MLLCAGADAAVSDHGNQTPLHIATERGRDKVVDLLLEAYRANVSAARLSDGKTPLHLACAGQFGNIEEVVHILLEEGADVAARDRTGSTPLHVGAELGRDQIVRILLRAG